MLFRSFLLLGLSFYSLPLFAIQTLIAAWVQYTDSGIEARAVVDASGACPNIVFNIQQTVPMEIRAIPRASHPDLVCYAAIPENTDNISINNVTLPVPKPAPQKILIIGDTGCRVSKKHGQYQACNNPTLWPFAPLAKVAAAQQPDLILYTGDYIYRESPCPEGNTGCLNTPWGDNLATWKADWLYPAKPLHLAAPIIFTRGNHENCQRAGMGWFRYIGAYSFVGECHRNMIPWVAKLANLQIAVMDTAYLKTKNGHSLVTSFSQHIGQINRKLTKPTWLLTHRPFWGYGADDDTNERVEDTKELQLATKRTALSDKIQLVIGAHIHQAQLVAPTGLAPQLVIGNSGTELVAPVEKIGTINDKKIVEQLTLNQYGFAMIKNNMNQWQLTFYDQAGHSLSKCLMVNKSIIC